MEHLMKGPQMSAESTVDQGVSNLQILEPALKIVSCNFTFLVKLKSHQQKVVGEIEKQRRGVLIGPAGCGKKVIALYSVFKMKLSALIVVRDESRFREWLELANARVDELVSDEEGCQRIEGGITIVLYDRLHRSLKKLGSDIDCLIVDECNASNLDNISSTIKVLKPSVVLGLTRCLGSTKENNFYMHSSIGALLGHIEYVFRNWRSTCAAILKSRRTDFCFDDGNHFSKALAELYKNPARNEIIIQDILHEAMNHRVLVVSEDAKHLIDLERLLGKARQPSVVVLGESTSEGKCHRLLEQFRKYEINVLLVTLEKLQELEVIDCSVLVIASPCPYGQFLIDACGKLRGVDDFNPPVVYDYLDGNAILQILYQERINNYEQISISRSISADLVQ